MPVPDYQSMMLPVLQVMGDDKVHSSAEICDEVAKRFSLSEDDLKGRLPSGKQTTFRNRVGWATTYLAKACLVVRPEEGQFQLTPRGRETLDSGVDRIDAKYLRQFPEFKAFTSGSSTGSGAGGAHVGDDVDAKTPSELIEAGYETVRAELADAVLAQVMSCSPEFFEQLVVDLLVAMGYGGSRADAARVGRSGDGGIDGIIKEDRLGLDAVYIQAKRWQGPVGRQVVQAFAGSLTGFKANKGVIITTSRFTEDALAYVDRVGMRIIPIDGPQLALLMIDFGIGVTEMASYTLKRLDTDYFEAGVL